MVCEFYDGGVIRVGTTAACRFTINMAADEELWFSTRLRGQNILITHELAAADELPVDEAGEVAMAAKAAAAVKEAEKRAAWKKHMAAQRD